VFEYKDRKTGVKHVYIPGGEEADGGFYDLYYMSPFLHRYVEQGIGPEEFSRKLWDELDQNFFAYWLKRFWRWITRNPSEADFIRKAARLGLE
jgi:hypothetical protein